jgi:(p)ppGpp synthase/HD superfamily hydrolase
MPNKNEDHAFESLSDLLGTADDIHAWRPDRFEQVAPSTEAEAQSEPSIGFDLEAFDRSRTLVLPAKREKPLCLIQVRDFALEIHTGQLNRYTKEPNWKHLAEVAGLVSTCSSNTTRAIALAWLHHTVADTAITLRDIERRFGASIADGVRCLTGSSNPLLTASVRKERDRKRLAEGDADVHTVRLADMAVDLVSIAHHNPQRARSGYLEEIRPDISVLSQGDEGLKKLVRNLWAEALRRVSSA